MTPDRRSTLLQIAIWSSLIVATLIVYGQSFLFDFVTYDDPAYVYDNPHVLGGVTLSSIEWAFTSATVATWVPATMLSHLATTQLFGTSAGMHHAVNILIHLLSVLLLFAVLQRSTGRRWASAFVALIFAIHPLHVESVAWISERKDVLSAFFFFLALYCYVRYAERPRILTYFLMLVAFGLGLLSKPMLVTFPFVLLIFDAWPLRRLSWPRSVWEKLPLLALSIGESAGTYWIQHRTISVQDIPLVTCISNALVSYLTYIGELLDPTPLAVFYPYPTAIPAARVLGSLAILIVVSTLVSLAWKTRPYYAVGWFWYLGMLLPVIGFVPAGFQSHADRYMYLPMVGLLVMLAWGIGDLIGRWPKLRPVVAGAAILVIGLLTTLAWKQTAWWQNSETLFQHDLDIAGENWVAHSNLGLYLTKLPGRRGEALDHLQAALRIQPNQPQVHNNLGGLLVEAGLCDAAIPHFEAGLRETPSDPGMHANLGLCLLKTGRFPEAVVHLRQAVRVRPDYLGASLNLATALSNIPGREAEAVDSGEAALRLMPNATVAHHALAVVLLRLGRREAALEHLEAEQMLQPTPEVARILDDLRTHSKMAQ